MKRMMKAFFTAAVAVTSITAPVALTGCGEKDNSAKIIKENPPSAENKAVKSDVIGRRRAEKAEADGKAAPAAPENK